MYHKWQLNHVWFFGYGLPQSKFFVILDHFLLFYSNNNPKNQNFQKMKKNHLEILSFLHECPINGNYIMYGSWDMEWNRQNFWPFWVTCCPFTLVTTWKIKILKKMKISSSVPKAITICYNFPDIWQMNWHFIFHLGLFSPLWTP